MPTAYVENRGELVAAGIRVIAQPGVGEPHDHPSRRRESRVTADVALPLGLRSVPGRAVELDAHHLAEVSAIKAEESRCGANRMLKLDGMQARICDAGIGRGFPKKAKPSATDADL